MKTKSAIEVLNAFKKIFNNRKPTKLRSDKGKEFENNLLKNFFIKNNVRHFTTTNSTIKCAIVERANRTLKEQLFKIFTYFRTKKWVNYLQPVLDSYNNSIHKSTKMAPNEVDKNDESIVFQNMYGAKNLKELFSQQFIKSKLNVGDNVRVKYDISSLDKSYYPMWSDVIYKIKQIIYKPFKPQYVIELDGEVIKRRFYPEELQKIFVDENTLYRIEKIISYRTKTK